MPDVSSACGVALLRKAVSPHSFYLWNTGLVTEFSFLQEIEERGVQKQGYLCDIIYKHDHAIACAIIYLTDCFKLPKWRPK